MINTLEKLKETVKTNQDFKQQLEDVWSLITEALEKIEDIKDNLEMEQGAIQEAIDRAVIKFNLED